MNLFEVIGRVMAEAENGSLKMEKKTLIIEGDFFTEMEKVATDWLNGVAHFAENTIIDSIKRVKYSGISFNDSLTYEHDALYGLTEYTPEDSDVKFWELVVQFDEFTDSGKVKTVKEKFIMPAMLQKEAIVKLEAEMAELTIPWRIINGKETQITSCLVMNETFKMALLKDGLYLDADGEIMSND